MIFTALSFYGLFTAYFLDEEVLPVRLYVLINVVLIFLNSRKLMLTCYFRATIYLNFWYL